MTETIEWIACTDQLPDDDTTVLIYAPADMPEEVKCGYTCDGNWYESGPTDSSDRMVLAEVTHWAAWPGGPE